MKLAKFIVAVAAIAFFSTGLLVVFTALELALTMTAYFDVFERIFGGFDYLRLTAFGFTATLALVSFNLHRLVRWLQLAD